MDLNIVSVDAGATLRDPFFAFGFVMITIALSVVTFAAVFVFRLNRPALILCSLVCAFTAWFLAKEARFAIEQVAGVAFAIANDGAGIGYWFMRPYVWASRMLAVAAAVLALFIRLRSRTRVAARAA